MNTILEDHLEVLNKLITLASTPGNEVYDAVHAQDLFHDLQGITTKYQWNELREFLDQLDRGIKENQAEIYKLKFQVRDLVRHLKQMPNILD